MRQLSGSLSDKIKQRLGLEPFLAVGIDWDGHGEVLYCDKTVAARRQAGLLVPGQADPSGGLVGKVLEVSGIDDVQQVAGGGSGSSGSVSITLDDTDGTIKAVIDTHDIPKQVV